MGSGWSQFCCFTLVSVFMLINSGRCQQQPLLRDLSWTQGSFWDRGQVYCGLCDVSWQHQGLHLHPFLLPAAFVSLRLHKCSCQGPGRTGIKNLSDLTSLVRILIFIFSLGSASNFKMFHGNIRPTAQGGSKGHHWTSLPVRHQLQIWQHLQHHL